MLFNYMSSGGQSEVPYTVISVREPLARVREITMRKQRAVAVQQVIQSLFLSLSLLYKVIIL